MIFEPFETHDLFKITKLFTMFEDFFPGGYEFKGEAHDFWECVYVEEGSVCICASERIYNLEKGDIIFHKPLEFHKYRIDAESAKLFIFSFSLEEKNTVFFEDKVFKLNEKQQNIIFQLIGFLHEKAAIPKEKDLAYCCYTLKKLSSDKKSSIHMSIVLNYIYSLLLSICDNSVTLRETELANTAVFKKAVNYMTENISAKLSISDIAKYCMISTTSLKNIFLDFSGIGVHKYFLKLKINRAIVLLSQGHSINEITAALGFSSQAYFSTAFKRETGVSPTKYID